MNPLTVRGAWLYENDPLDLAKIAKYAIEVLYVDPRSGNAADNIKQLRDAGVIPGIYFDPHNFDRPTILAQAQTISDFVQKGQLNADGTYTKLLQIGEPVMVDLEQLPQAWLSEFIHWYRSYLPSRPTSVTLGPGQDSSIVPVAAFVAAGIHLVVQLYEGTLMTPAPASKVWATNESLVAAGYPRSLIHPFYDGKAFPWNATSDGTIFTSERLPA